MNAEPATGEPGLGEFILSLEASRAWGDPPQLHLLYATGPGRGLPRYRTGLIDLPPKWLETERPFLVMQMLADKISAMPGAQQTPVNMVGVAFAHDGWRLRKRGDLDWDEIEAVGRHRLIHEHPLAEEGCLVHAADFGGTIYLAERLRESKAAPQLLVLPPGQDAPFDYGGDIKACLLNLLEVFGRQRAQARQQNTFLGLFKGTVPPGGGPQ